MGKEKGAANAKERLDVATLLGLISGPSLMYIFTCYCRSSRLHYDSNIASWFFAILLLVIWCALACKPSFSSSRSRLWTFVLLTGLFAWFSGLGQGEHLYIEYARPYFDIKNLNSYPDVEVDSYRGSGLMDLGTVSFVPGTYLNLSMSYGFKNEDMYCVAPIVSDKMLFQPATVFGPSISSNSFSSNSSNASSSSSSSGGSTSASSSSSSSSSSKAKTPVYDFWAVGTNCCSGHMADFHCGEFDSMGARSGLRLMRDEDRGYFKLAVEEAAAAYNIQADHPIFLYWMTSPENEIRSYQEDGDRGFIFGCVYFALFQCFLTALAISSCF